MLAQLDNFELALGDDDTRHLSLHEKRVIQLFGKKNDAAVADITHLSGGLSGAGVYRVRLLSGVGSEFQRAVVKIGSFEKVSIENENFNKYVQQLDVGSFPTLLGEFFAGCGVKKGVFFQLANNFDRTFFEWTEVSDSDAAETVAKLSVRLGNWHGNTTARKMTIREVRESQLSDNKFEAVKVQLDGLDVDQFEGKSVQVKLSVQHGDLHGANVLVADTGDPVVIDYGDIGEGLCSLDPAVLELSFYFHPNSRDRFRGSTELAEHWFSNDVFEYVDNPHVSRALRAWCDGNQFSVNERAAITYAYCVRQLSYEGTDKDFAIALIRRAMEII